MKSLLSGGIALGAILLTAAPSPGAPLSALTTFGGDGWLAPSEATFLQGANLQRGMTYSAKNNHLYVVDRNGGTFVRIVDGDTGALVGSLDTTGITGGTFPLNMVDVDDDGVIYAASLNGDTDASVLKVYRWATEASLPTVAYDSSASPVANGADIRIGDDLAVIGSGANTRIVTGGNSATAPGNPGDNAFVVLTTTDGLAYSAAVQDFVGVEPANGALRLGIDFVDANTVIGRQASGGEAIVATFAAGTATQTALAELVVSGEAPLAVDRTNDLLATVQVIVPTGGVGAINDVRLYDIANPDSPILLDTQNLTTSVAPVANGNGTGDLKFGRFGGQFRLYVLNTNNGIQAFTVVPEPASLVLLACSGLALACRRRLG
ncbi:MAG: hypothetical protein DCC67_12085 [Planctomycetota bacterium]|nr:MAG: hypothetical protein DCC67_12085 [Planctomycetota bacterium]